MSVVEQYPEHAKQHAIIQELVTVREFLEEAPYVLAEWSVHDEQFVPVGKSIEKVLAEYFHIDLDKIEAERRQMLEKMREMNA